MLNFAVQGIAGDGSTLYDEAFYNVVMEKIDSDEPKRVVGDSAEPVGTVENKAPAPESMPVTPAVEVAPVAVAPVAPVAPVAVAPVAVAVAPVAEPAQETSVAEVADAEMDNSSEDVSKLLGMFG